MKEKSEFKDIFKGQYINVWEDEDLVYISFPWCTMNFNKEDYEEIKKDVEEWANL